MMLNHAKRKEIMIKLSSIRDYIKNTVDTLSIATGMEAIICDEKCRILADSNYEQTKETDFRENHEILSAHSIVRECIDEKRTIVINDCRKENPSCWSCVNAKTCEIRSIIAYPIILKGEVLGGIGMYAADRGSQILLNEKNEIFDFFVKKMCEMMISKAEEKEISIAFQSTSERLRLLIESLDEAIIGFDENDSVININRKFYNIFNTTKDSVRDFRDICTLIKNKKFEDFTIRCFNEKIPQKTMLTVNDSEMIISFKPILVDGKYTGSLLHFKKGSDIYKDMRTIKENDFYKISFEDIAGKSPQMNELKEKARRFAKGPSNIFIQGRSGTGKEMFARAIHNESLVSNGPFVAVNCAAIPENLLESELFGHKEGAFTGSMKGGKIGKFELADKGTLFLDEVGELPLHLQPKLLRAIQEKRIQPVGSNKYIPVDIRIIAATNRDIEEMVAQGLFREDLFYRLNVIPLYIPKLSERKSDVPELLDVFLDRYNLMLDKNIIDFDFETKKILCDYRWPGNIRELQNVVEYAVNACRGNYVTVRDLPPRIAPALDGAASFRQGLAELIPLKDMEKMCIQEALRKYGSTSEGKSRAAKALGIGRSTFYRKLSEYKLD